VETGDTVSLYYDSLLAKLIVHAEDRSAAIRRMERALNELVVVGVATNQAFHRRLLADPAFRAGEVDIQFLERRSDLLARPEEEARERLLAVAVALAEDQRRREQKPAIGDGTHGNGAWGRAAREDARQ
jgi:acetyl/propionyl-CoA carboxylase alpha subunit